MIYETREIETNEIAHLYEEYGEIIGYPNEEHLDEQFEKFAEIKTYGHRQGRNEFEPTEFEEEYNHYVIAFDKDENHLYIKNIYRYPEIEREYKLVDLCEGSTMSEELEEASEYKAKKIITGGYKETCTLPPFRFWEDSPIEEGYSSITIKW